MLSINNTNIKDNYILLYQLLSSSSLLLSSFDSRASNTAAPISR
jgi:hypothetical protein